MAGYSSSRFSFTFVPTVSNPPADLGDEADSAAADLSLKVVPVDDDVISQEQISAPAKAAETATAAVGADVLPPTAARTPSNTPSSSSSAVARAFSVEWLSSWICKSSRADAPVDRTYAKPRTLLEAPTVEAAADEVTTESVSLLTSMKARLWTEIEKQAVKLSNPDVQFAGLI
jgi:hypothetical protein